MPIALFRTVNASFRIRSHLEENLTHQPECHVEGRPHEIQIMKMRGEDENLNEMIGDCMPRLFRAADCILRNRHDSEDALQDGLLSALLHMDQFKGNSKFSTWLHSIVRNSALAKSRRERAHPTVPLEGHYCEKEDEFDAAETLADPRPDPERASTQAELSCLFAQSLKYLPPQYSAIIRLCDFEGFSGKEAAKRLGLSVSALKAQHHRARVAIRESMGVHATRKSGQNRESQFREGC
jgi:RNA polymerase sigma-70 factor (ECF subfamily)